MMAGRSRRTERGVAFAAVLVMTGCIFLFGASERRIADEAAANEAALAALRIDEAALAARPVLDAQAARLRASLGGAEHRAPGRSPASAFLSDAARAAAARRTTITLLAAETQRTAAAGTSVPFTLGLEGRYADVLATIRSVSTLRVPASLVLTALTRSTATTGEPTIAATLRVELQPRNADAAPR